MKWIVESGAALRASVERRYAPQWKKAHSGQSLRSSRFPLTTHHFPVYSRGFTLIEMIMVIVITGIIGAIVAVFLRAPIDQYMDVARRAELTDIADTALRRVTRDLRLALPNSVRVRNAAGTACNGAQACYLEYIPSIGGGRYRDSVDGGGLGDPLLFSAADISFDVLGTMPTVAAGDQIVVYNLGIPGADAYAGKSAATHNRRAVSGVAGSVISITSVNVLPFDSCIYDTGGFVIGGCRFQVAQNPVTYVCDPVAGTLVRWQEASFQAVQPIAVPAGQPILASNITACSFSYDSNVVAQRSGLVTMRLSITQDAETVTLYNASHVSNQP